MSNDKGMTDAERLIEMNLNAQKRVNNCLVDIQNALQRWNCKINPIVTISGMGIQGTFQIIPIEEIPKMRDN